MAFKVFSLAIKTITPPKISVTLEVKYLINAIPKTQKSNHRKDLRITVSFSSPLNDCKTSAI